MRICQYCRASARPDDPVQECGVYDERYLIHRGCQDDWLKAMDALPASSVLGKALGGQRCELCGEGRYVYRIRLPGKEEAAERHRHCAGRYWRKIREVPRHSWKDDYNCHIGSTKWKRFRCEVIKQGGKSVRAL